jgi:hypothetical protein
VNSPALRIMPSLVLEGRALEVLKEIGIAAGAFHDRAYGASGQASQFVVRQGAGALHGPGNGHLPVGSLDGLRHREVLHHIEQMRRRHEAVQIRHRRSDPHHASLFVVQEHRPGLVAARPAQPLLICVDAWLGHGGTGGVHTEKIGIQILALARHEQRLLFVVHFTITQRVHKIAVSRSIGKIVCRPTRRINPLMLCTAHTLPGAFSP